VRERPALVNLSDDFQIIDERAPRCPATLQRLAARAFLHAGELLSEERTNRRPNGCGSSTSGSVIGVALRFINRPKIFS
jgi:hypothetical protein